MFLYVFFFSSTILTNKYIDQNIVTPNMLAVYIENENSKKSVHFNLLGIYNSKSGLRSGDKPQNVNAAVTNDIAIKTLEEKGRGALANSMHNPLTPKMLAKYAANAPLACTSINVYIADQAMSQLHIAAPATSPTLYNADVAGGRARTSRAPP